MRMRMRMMRKMDDIENDGWGWEWWIKKRVKIKVGIIVDSPSDWLCLDGGLPAYPPAVVRVLMQQSLTIINITIIANIIHHRHRHHHHHHDHRHPQRNWQWPPCQWSAGSVLSSPCSKRAARIHSSWEQKFTDLAYFLFHYFYEVNRHCLPISIL